MKIRTSFVTNSSSSSFIFGEPKVVSGNTVKDILNNLEKRAKQILQVIRYLEKEIDNAGYTKVLEQIRKEHFEWEQIFYTDSWEDEELVTEQMLNVTEAEKELEDLPFYKRVIYKAYELYGKELEEYYISFAVFQNNIQEVLYDNYTIDKLNNIKDYLEPLLKDFKQPKLDSYNYDAVCLLSRLNFEDTARSDSNSEEFKVYLMENSIWEVYGHTEELKSCSDEKLREYEAKYVAKQEELRESDIDYNKAIFDTLGEFGIYGVYECTIPQVILDILSKEAKLSYVE